jgi:hypothetical protein
MDLITRHMINKEYFCADFTRDAEERMQAKFSSALGMLTVEVPV